MKAFNSKFLKEISSININDSNVDSKIHNTIASNPGAFPSPKILLHSYNRTPKIPYPDNKNPVSLFGGISALRIVFTKSP